MSDWSVVIHRAATPALSSRARCIALAVHRRHGTSRVPLARPTSDMAGTTAPYREE